MVSPKTDKVNGGRRPPIEAGRQLVSMDTAAGLLGISVREVRRLISRGELTGLRIPGTHMLRIPLSEVDAVGTPVVPNVDGGDAS